MGMQPLKENHIEMSKAAAIKLIHSNDKDEHCAKISQGNLCAVFFLNRQQGRNRVPQSTAISHNRCVPGGFGG